MMGLHSRIFAPPFSLTASRPPRIIRGLAQGVVWREDHCRGIAQSGSASGLGPEGRGFKSLYPDQLATYERL